MAPRNLKKASKDQQQQLHQEAQISTPTIPKIKRKNLLHCCKLCPEKSYPVSAQSKIRPANPSVEGHVLKEHPGIHYTSLTRRWGHQIIYEDGSVERLPLVDQGDIEEEDLRVNAESLQSGGYEHDPDFELSQEDQDLYSTLCKVRSSVQYGREGHQSNPVALQQAIAPVSVSQEMHSLAIHTENCFPFETFSAADNRHHTNEFREGDAPSPFADLPVLELDEAQFQLRVAKIRPFDGNNPFDKLISTHIDPRLTSQENSQHYRALPSRDQNEAGYPAEITANNDSTTNQLTLFSDPNQAQNVSVDEISEGQGLSQVHIPGALPDTAKCNFAAFESMQKDIMEQKHLRIMSHNNSIPFETRQAPIPNFDLQDMTDGHRRQLLNSAYDQSFTLCDGKAKTSSSGSTRDAISQSAYLSIPTLRRTPVFPQQQSTCQTATRQTSAPFEVPEPPASASRPAARRSRSSRSPAESNGLIKQPKTPTASPQKRKASTAHPQTPTPKSRRSDNISPTPTKVQTSNAPKAQAKPSIATIISYQDLLDHRRSTPATLRINSRGSLVFPRVKFNQLHPLDQEALTGHHGERVTDLSRMAIFGNGADDAHGRTRERQLIDMVAYLRVQRDLLYSRITGGEQGASVEDSGLNGDGKVNGNGRTDFMA